MLIRSKLGLNIPPSISDRVVETICGSPLIYSIKKIDISGTTFYTPLRISHSKTLEICMFQFPEIFPCVLLKCSGCVHVTDKSLIQFKKCYDLNWIDCRSCKDITKGACVR